MLKKIWDGFVHLVVWAAKAVWAPVSDHEWNADPYKIGGFMAFGFAGWIAIKVIDLVSKPIDSTVFVTLAGLVSVFVGVGTFLFSQSRKSDESLMNKGPDDGSGS